MLLGDTLFDFDVVERPWLEIPGGRRLLYGVDWKAPRAHQS